MKAAENLFCHKRAMMGEPLVYRNGEPVTEKFVYDGATHYPYRVGDRYYNANGRVDDEKTNPHDIFLAYSNRRSIASPGEPFSLHAAMAGEPLVFRNGMKAEAQFRYHGESVPFAFRLECVVEDGKPHFMYYNAAGRRYEGMEDPFDLFMARKPVLPASGAIELLDKAAGHMRDRAANYDKPEGERSMAKTVKAFNAITGRNLTEPEGWLLMSCLKKVRAFTNPHNPHRDSLEDGIAYQALMAESMLR